MSDQTNAHEAVVWAKQRLDDLDTMISEAEKTTDKLKASANKEAEIALARLQESRHRLQKYHGELLAQADAAKRGAENIQDAIETEWVEVETAFQSFLSVVEGHANAARDIVAARVKAQRQSWEASLKDLRNRATETVEKARGDLDAAIERLLDQAETFQSRIGEAKDAGDESWKAVKSGLVDAKAAHDRTVQRIKDAFAGLL
jgi:hypothetical protein